MMWKLLLPLASAACFIVFAADAQDCDQCPGQNEFYDTCISGCSSQSCETIGIIIHCPIQTTVCRTGCRCKPNFCRNSDKVCVSVSEWRSKISTSTAAPVITETNPTTTATEKSPSADSYDNNANDNKNDLDNVKDGVTDFTGKFLYDLIKSSQGKNIIASPYSAFTALGQLALYADGESLKQLATILHLSDKQGIRNAFPALAASFENQTSVDFLTAVALFTSRKHPVLNRFLKDSADFFNAEAQVVDFSNSDEASNAINSWVERKTNDRIKDLIAPSDISSLTRLVMVNAIYFKGDWLYSFDKANTKDADFYLSDGTTQKTKLMYQEGRFNYGEDSDLDCKVLEMPYKGKNFTMVIVLPNQIDGIVETAKSLQDISKFNTVLSSMYSQKVQVYLPPFEINTTTDLEEILKEEGVTKIFDQTDSGLSGILKNPENIYVSKAIQKAFIKVDETGSEAAAANGIIFPGNLPAPPQQPKIFRADRAFLFFIRIKATTMFCGTYIQ